MILQKVDAALELAPKIIPAICTPHFGGAALNSVAAAWL